MINLPAYKTSGLLRPVNEDLTFAHSMNDSAIR